MWLRASSVWDNIFAICTGTLDQVVLRLAAGRRAGVQSLYRVAVGPNRDNCWACWY